MLDLSRPGEAGTPVYRFDAALPQRSEAARADWLLLNPAYTLMEVVRGPLLSGGASLAVWLSALFFTVFAAVVALAFFVRFRGRIAFWV